MAPAVEDDARNIPFRLEAPLPEHCGELIANPTFIMRNGVVISSPRPRRLFLQRNPGFENRIFNVNTVGVSGLIWPDRVPKVATLRSVTEFPMPSNHWHSVRPSRFRKRQLRTATLAIRHGER